MTKILCAVDNTDHSKLAIAMAGKLARAFDAELTLLAVNQAIGPYGNTPVAFWTESEI